MRKCRRGRVLSLWGALIAGALLTVPARALAPPRVASVELCADQYVMMLADRSQIATVSHQATGPLAYYAEQARGLRRNFADLETLIAADADLVIMDEGTDTSLRRALQRLNISMVMLRMGATFEDVEANIRMVAAALHQSARGESVIADMRRRRARLEANLPPVERRPIALYYRPDGGGAGADTFVDTAMSLGGFRNLQAMSGQVGWRGLNLEDAAMTPPQAYLVSFFDTNRNSLSAGEGRNPVLRRARAPVINVPGKYWICASPSIIDASEFMAQARLEHFPERLP
jgi:iron complex transport system substrate-binding protein